MRVVLAVMLVSLGSVAHGQVPTTIAPPSISDKEFVLTDYGAVGDGKTLATAAFQKAAAAIGANGGGVLVVPKGTFLCAPLTLHGHMALELEGGAVIKATDDFSAWGLPAPLPSGGTAAPALRLSSGAFITVDKGDDFEIRGTGTIDGSGLEWWKHVDKPTYHTAGAIAIPRPRLLVINNGRNVYIHDVTLTNSPSFHLVPRDCENVLIDHVSIIAPGKAPNTDAIDPSNCTNVIIRNCLLDVGDDDVAIKSGGAGKNPPCDNILVADCTIKHGHGVSIGSETDAGVHHMLVRDCTFDGTGPGLRIKSSRTRGGDVADITYQNLTLKNIDGNAIEINTYYQENGAERESQPVTKTTPHIKDILFQHIRVESAKRAGIIVGLPEAPIENVRLEDVTIHATSGMTVRDAEGVVLDKVTIVASKGEALTSSFAKVTGTAAGAH